MKRLAVIVLGVAAALGLSACIGDHFPSGARVNEACKRDGGAAYISQRNPPGDEGNVNFIERCKDNRIVVVKP